jgi:hypothetical protein
MKKEDYEKSIEQAKNYYTSHTKSRHRNYHSNDPQSLYDDIHYFRKYMYTPGIGIAPRELKQATDAALRIKSYRPELKDVPLAENPYWPTEQDFIRLEQWFINAQEPPEVFPMNEEEAVSGSKKKGRGAKRRKQ